MSTPDNYVPVEKSEDNEQPVPTDWRGVLKAIVKSFVKRDYQLDEDVAGVVKVSQETATQIQKYIDDYGEELVELPDETWKSSVCTWIDPHWDVLVDLWTEGEGRSDLVLHAQVTESNGDGYTISVYMVYVP